MHLFPAALSLSVCLVLASGIALAQPSDPLPDRDGDGLADDTDSCPDEPEDRDGFEDPDGCPDLDNDGDLAPDSVDTCPLEPEKKNGFMDDDGCPDALLSKPLPPSGCDDGPSCKAAGDVAWRAMDHALAARLYRSACASGDANACGALGIVVEQEGVAMSFERALALYRWACGKSVREACHNLGVMTRNGRGVPANPTRASVYLQQACDLGFEPSCAAVPGVPVPAPAVPAPAPTGDCVDARACDEAGWSAFGAKRYEDAARHGARGCDLGAARACAMIGHLHNHGYGVAKDQAKGLAFARTACAGGDQSGCHNVAVRLVVGDVVPQDLVEARRLYEAACKTGFTPSCAGLEKLPEPDVRAPTIAAYEKKDYRGAAMLAKPLCDGGDAHACGWLGMARWELGQKKDAVAPLDKACAGGFEWSCWQLADAYWAGDGVRKDQARGLRLVRRACELGSVNSCHAAAQWSYQLDEVGVAWFVRACDLKDVAGCSMAAQSYADGGYGPSDLALAVKYGQAACDLESWSDCHDVASAYCEGRGATPDVPRCERGLKLACEHGDEPACDELEDRFE